MKIQKFAKNNVEDRLIIKAIYNSYKKNYLTKVYVQSIRE